MRLIASAPLLCMLVLTSSVPARIDPGSSQLARDAGYREHLPRDDLRRRTDSRHSTPQDFRRMRLAGPFPAEVLTVIDGDTFEARVTVWLGHEVTTRVRLLGIDAAEMGSECAEERELAALSRAALDRMLGRRVLLGDVRFDKYGGRVLARALDEAGRDVAQRMLADGYALSYEGGRRQAWCDAIITSRR